MAVAVMTGCSGKEDAWCSWDFKIANNTELNVAAMSNGAIMKEVIAPNNELTISSSGTLCSKQDSSLSDYYPDEEELMDVFSLVTPTIRIKVGDELLPETAMKRKYWKYTSEKYHGTYTLTLTDELIETIKSEQ